MIKQVLFLVLAILILSGCVTTQNNYVPRKVDISKPPLGKAVNAYVGETLLIQGKYVEHDAIYVGVPLKVNWAYKLLPGYFVKQGDSNDAEFFRPGSGPDGGSIKKAAIADPWKSVMAYKNKSSLCVITVFNVPICKNDLNYERKKKKSLVENSFQQTLIYLGTVGKKIKIGYREFSNNRARPAYNTEVQYDLNKSNIIGYKGARLEIIKSTNEYIRYKVIKNFNKSKI